MGKETSTFGDIKVESHKFHQHKSPISTYDLEINKTVVSNSFLLVKKALNMLLVTKMVKSQTIMCTEILLEKYEICQKVSNNMKMIW